MKRKGHITGKRIAAVILAAMMIVQIPAEAYAAETAGVYEDEGYGADSGYDLPADDNDGAVEVVSYEDMASPAEPATEPVNPAGDDAFEEAEQDFSSDDISDVQLTDLWGDEYITEDDVADAGLYEFTDEISADEDGIADETEEYVEEDEPADEIEGSADALEAKALDSGTCGAAGNEDKVLWSVSGKYVLTIEGSGAMADYASSAACPWNKYTAKIVKVVMDDDVTNVGNYAFANMKALTSVKLGSKLTKIGDHSFELCTSLASVTIPDGVTSIGAHAFKRNDSIRKIVIPKDVKTIQPYTFAGCHGLTSVTLPDGLTEIKDHAFYYADALKNIELPASLTTVDSFASTFMECPKLEHINIKEGGEVYKSVDGVVCKKDADKWQVIYMPIGWADSMTYTVPEGIDSIGLTAFSYNTVVTELHIPDTVTEMVPGAILDWPRLQKAVFTGDSRFTTIPERAFTNCKDLNRVEYENMPASLNVGDMAFALCEDFAGIYCGTETIPVGSIGNKAFIGCGSLADLELTSLAAATAFKDNTDNSMPKNLIFSEAVSGTIPANQFSGWENLRQVTFRGAVYHIGEKAFFNCAGLESVVFERNDHDIVLDKYAFNSSSSLTGLYHDGQPAKLGDIYGNSTVTEGSTVKDTSSFGYCSSLETIALGSSCASITRPDSYTVTINLFPGCTSLNSITVSPDNEYYYSVDGVLFAKTYKDAGNTDRSNVLLKYPAGRKTQSYRIPGGTTAIASYAFAYTDAAERIVISGDVSLIDNYAMVGCRAYRIEWSSEESSLQKIGTGALRGCVNLTELTVPEGVSVISGIAFETCTSLKRVDLPLSLTTLGLVNFGSSVNDGKDGSYMFGGDSALKQVIIRNPNLAFADYMFFNTPQNRVYLYAADTSTTKTYADGYTAKGEGGADPVFVDISKLDGAEDPALAGGTAQEDAGGDFAGQKDSAEGSVADVLHWAYTSEDATLTIGSVSGGGRMLDRGPANYTLNPWYGSIDISAVHRVVIEEGITDIGLYAFKNMTSLTEAVLPASMTVIGSTAFDGCSALEVIDVSDGNNKYVNISGLPGFLFLKKIEDGVLKYKYHLGNLRRNMIIDGVNRDVLYIPRDLTASKIDSACLASLDPDSIRNKISDAGCTGIYVEPGNTAYRTDAEHKALYTADGKKLLAVAGGVSGAFAVLPGTTVIGSCALYDCSSITRVELPSSLREIGANAFEGCSGLTMLEIPEGTERIGEKAFNFCSALGTIYIPESVNHIHISGTVKRDANHDLTGASYLSTPFDYCPASLIVYVSDGSYAYSYVYEYCYKYYDGTNVLVRDFEYDPVGKYHITYMLDRARGEINDPANPASFRAGDPGIILKDPIKPEAEFGGWFTDSSLTKQIFSISPMNGARNYVLYPKWTEYHEVFLNVNGAGPYRIPDGMSVSEAVKAGRIVLITDEDVPGYRVAGYFLGEDPTAPAYDLSTPVTEDITLTARLVPLVETAVQAPMANVLSGVVAPGTEVSITCDTPDTVIYYTMGGSDPDQTSASYTDRIMLLSALADGNGQIVIKARAFKNGAWSQTSAYTYTLADTSSDWGSVLIEDRVNFDNADDIPEGIWVAQVPDTVTYTGKKISPAVRVYFGRTLLKSGTDYSISYKNNINVTKQKDIGTAKAPTITVKGKRNFKDSHTEHFVITPASIRAAAVTYRLPYDSSQKDVFDRVIANKKVQKIKPVLKAGGKTLKEGKDYKLAYDITAEKDYKSPGTYDVTVNGIGNFEGTKPLRFIIAEQTVIPINKVTIQSGFKSKVDYADGGVTQSPVFKYEYTGTDGKKHVEGLTKDTDYVLSFTGNTAPGTAKMIVMGKGKYAGTMTKTFKIKGFSMKDCHIYNMSATMPYTGSAIYQPGAFLFRVTSMNPFKYVVLSEGRDYTVSYKNNIKTGTATVTYTGKGSYTGKLTGKFKIKAYSLKSDAKKKNPLINVQVGEARFTKGGAKPDVKVYYGGRLLTSGKDYKLSYKNNNKAVKAAEAGKKPPTVTVTGKGCFTGSVSQTFDIATKDIGGLTMTAADVVFKDKNGNYVPKVTIKDTDGKALKAGTDYDKTFVYTYAEPGDGHKALDPVGKDDKVPAGTLIRITVNAAGSNYTGSVSALYRIGKADISKAKVTVNKKAVFAYSGLGQRPLKDQLTVKLGSKTLEAGAYEIIRVVNNVNTGKASVTLRGMGPDYCGTKTFTIKITPRSVK